MRRLAFLFLFLCQSFAWGIQPIETVRVLKSQHKLQLISEGKVLYEFKVALGKTPTGHKQQSGDGKTPEGTYLLDYKKLDSAFYKAIHISYPNPKDVEKANTLGVDPGGQIMIHGQKNGFGWLAFITQQFDWTNGCIALSNSDMDILWKLIKEGTEIRISP